MTNTTNSPTLGGVPINPHLSAFTEAIGRRLLAEGLIDEMALRRAERARQQSGERFDLVLARLGLVPEEALVAVLASEIGMPTAAKPLRPYASALDAEIDPAFLKAKRILPLDEGPDRIVVAVADPFDTASLQALAFHTEKVIEPHIAATGDIDQALERLYGADGTSSLAAESATSAGYSHADDVRRLEDLASEAPIIRLVQDIIVRAVEARASDIHVEPRTDNLRIRYRIDGVLHTVETLAPDLAAGVTSRIKILSRLDIAERRLPQDGRTRSVVRGRELDLRVSTVPTMSGESCVLRLLDRNAVPLDFSALGFAPDLQDGIEALLRQPHGIVLVTGPTGSGKTTTLYTALRSLNAETAKILTVEDPIEYRLPDINQMQVQPRIALTFATALRSILRQDPDVIMIGEIRDLETAQIAIQASLTGHLVLSTVHTNSAAATVTRLLDMGVENYLLASSVTGVLAQRLVRRICHNCAVPHQSASEIVDRLAAEAGVNAANARLLSRGGCPECRNTGYVGRIAIGELLVMSGTIRDMIHARGLDHDIETAAIAGGMRTLYRDGLMKVLAGETTLEELLRVTRLG